MPHISSQDNPRLKDAMRLLASSRERRKAGRCVLEGVHLVSVYLVRHGAPESLIVAGSAAANPEIDALTAAMPPTRVSTIDASVWTKLTQLPIDVGVLAVVPAPRPVFRHTAGFCLLLEDIQDPGNVGSILRSAAAAGVEQVFLSKGCAFAWSPKVLRAGQGGHFHLEIFEDVDLVDWARNFRGALIAAVAHGGQSLFEARLAAPIAVAVGNEGAGLSPALRAAATYRVSIPMPGGFESLNAAAAAAVCLFECARQGVRATGV